MTKKNSEVKKPSRTSEDYKRGYKNGLKKGKKLGFDNGYLCGVNQTSNFQ